MVDKALFTSNKDDWETPDNLFNWLHDTYEFTVDAAASHDNAKLPRYWTKQDGALDRDWSGERVWCNPPYGKIAKQFIEKAAKCEAERAVLLIPARTDTIVWHDHILRNPNACVCFLKGRLTFKPAVGPAPFPSAVVVFYGGQKAEAPHNIILAR